MAKKGINRRLFLQTTATAGIASGMYQPDSSEAQSSAQDNMNTTRGYLSEKSRRAPFTVRKGSRPHIFLISADMISPDCYLPSRDISNHVKLDNIRSIGQAGTRFDNALCTIPLCGPSRASIFTGVYPPYLTNGERAPLGMKLDLAHEDIIFQEYLRASGYQTKHVGKCHVGADKFLEAFGENDDAWNRWAPPVMDDDDYASYLDDLDVKPPRYKKELRGKQYDRKTPGNSYGGWIEQENGEPFPLKAHYSSYLADKAIKKLRTAIMHGSGEPVYLQLDFFDPHQPFTIPAGFEDRAEELRRQIKLPDSYERVRKNDFKPLPNEPDIYNVYRRSWGTYDPELVREYIIGHFLQMEVVDHCVGMLLDEIRQLGIWDDSLIIFTGDHGEMNGRLGLFDKGVYFQPDIFRVPLFIKTPERYGSMRQPVIEPVSTLDISQTILSCAGITTGKYSDGRNLIPVMTNGDSGEIREMIFQTGWHVGVNYGIGVNHYESPDRHWFLGYNISSGIAELYNMSEDDSINRFYGPESKEIATKMILRLGEILKADRRWLGYWSTFRLHFADVLPVTNEDMQMVVPLKN